MAERNWPPFPVTVSTSFENSDLYQRRKANSKENNLNEFEIEQIDEIDYTEYYEESFGSQSSLSKSSNLQADDYRETLYAAKKPGYSLAASFICVFNDLFFGPRGTIMQVVHFWD